MGKNRKFKTTYLLTINGVTSNGYQAQLFDKVIRAVCTAFGVNSQQSQVSIKVVDSEGDYDAETQKMSDAEKAKE